MMRKKKEERRSRTDDSSLKGKKKKFIINISTLKASFNNTNIPIQKTFFHLRNGFNLHYLLV